MSLMDCIHGQDFVVSMCTMCLDREAEEVDRLHAEERASAAIEELQGLRDWLLNYARHCNSRAPNDVAEQIDRRVALLRRGETP